MKELDSLARFQGAVVWVVVIACLVGGAAAVSAIGKSLCGDCPVPTQIFIFLAVGGVGSILLLVLVAKLGDVVEGAFSWTRQRMGMKTVDEVEREIRNDLVVVMDRRRSWFLSLPEKEQHYELWELLRRQRQDLQGLSVLVVLAVVAAVAAVLLAWTIRSHG